MKAFLYVILVLQLLLFAYGIVKITENEIELGLFHVIIHAICMPININTLIQSYINSQSTEK